MPPWNGQRTDATAMQHSQLASQHHRVLHQLVTSVRPGSRGSASVSTARQWQAGMLQYRALLASNAGMTDALSVYPVHRSAISASSKDWRAQHCKPGPTGICCGGGEGGLFKRLRDRRAANGCLVSALGEGEPVETATARSTSHSISRYPKIPTLEGDASCSTKAGLPIPWPLACTAVEKGSTTFRNPYLLLLVAICIDYRRHAALYWVHSWLWYEALTLRGCGPSSCVT
jgi:hypothetical protein